MKKLLTLTAIIGIFVLGFYFYFHNIGRIQPNVNEIFVTSADVPDHFDGVRIVQISDLLVRSETCLDLLENVVNTVNNNLNPDIIIFTGNLFLSEGIPFENRVTDLLSRLNANFVKIAVLGYHDLPHYELISNVLSAADFRLLYNYAFQVFNVFNQSPIGINVIGAAPTNDRNTMIQLLEVHARDDLFNLLLMSVPTFSTTAFEHPIHVQLSGHCLATQDTTSQVSPCFQFYNGTYQFADSFTLHISPGLARFHTISGLFRQPSIDSFLLIRRE